jgi:hypothetical protein
MMTQVSRSSLIDDVRVYNPGCKAVAYPVSIGAGERQTASPSSVLQARILFGGKDQPKP